ncbi:hypothetical protein Tco_1065761, partial [Tanacetum coccineum]
MYKCRGSHYENQSIWLRGSEGNAAERYKGDNNMAALGVAVVIEESAHELLTFRDAIACEVIFKWISVMKEDMDTRSSMCMLSNSFKRSSDDSNIYYWKYTPARLRSWLPRVCWMNVKEIILGMEVFRFQSSNALRVLQFRFSNGMSVQVLLGGHFMLSLEGDEEKKMSELGFEQMLVAVIATCALTKVVPVR